ncbi:MAG: hypothetical protein EOO73_02650 [Myxococcales bacterium]|nr:MAG: hypothetical protein EOO73_02650 [Myxococcales bacterium]
MLVAMRVSVAWLVSTLAFGYSACWGDSFRSALPVEGASGASQAGAEGEAEGGRESEPIGGTSGDSAGAAAGGAAAGAGGEAGTGGSGPDPEYTTSSLIDDMEDGDSGLAETNGDWYVLRDASVGVVTPPQGIPFTMTPLTPPRGDSHWAAQVQVAGFQGWGAAFGFDFVYVEMKRQPYSLEDFEALRFWVRASSETELKLQVPNADTDPFGDRCLGTEGENACFAHFSAAFAAGPEWREVTIAFRDLRQEGVGRTAASFDAQHVFSVLFVVGPKQELSVAVDDVRLVK